MKTGNCSSKFTCGPYHSNLWILVRENINVERYEIGSYKRILRHSKYIMILRSISLKNMCRIDLYVDIISIAKSNFKCFPSRSVVILCRPESLLRWCLPSSNQFLQLRIKVEMFCSTRLIILRIFKFMISPPVFELFSHFIFKWSNWILKTTKLFFHILFDIQFNSTIFAKNSIIGSTQTNNVIFVYIFFCILFFSTEF